VDWTRGPGPRVSRVKVTGNGGGSASVADELSKLGQLHDQGALTDDEHQQQKGQGRCCVVGLRGAANR
jgi:hypothetical protein